MGRSARRRLTRPRAAVSLAAARRASAAASFWAEHGATRWASALRTEQRYGLAVCDTDPLKLHYGWSLWRIGVANAEEFERQAAAYRKMVDHRRIGFADRYLVSIPNALTLESRRSADRSRRRRNFELHVRLAGPLRIGTRRSNKPVRDPSPGS